MSSALRIQRVTHESGLIPQLVDLHWRCLPSTLTSNRGAGTVEGLYRSLLRRNHVAFAAVQGDEVIGGVVVSKSGVPVPTTYLLLHQPWSWVLALSRLGVSSFVQQIADLLSLRSSTSRLGPHDYIIALYVSEKSRRTGVATELLRECIAAAASSRVALGVDTTINNDSALHLYRSNGFVEKARTRISVLLMRSAE